MFQKNNFVRGRRRRSDAIVQKFFILIGVFFIGILGIAAYLHLSSGQGDAANIAMQPLAPIDDGLIEVIIPINNITPGTGFQPQMFRKVKKPEVVVGPETVRSFEDLKGMYAKGVLVANNLVNREFITNLQPVNALTATIPSGYRAIAIAVNATSSVEGWAQGGARVDVVWVTDFTGRNIATTIAHNVKVLSANRRTEVGPVNAKGKSGARAQQPEEAIPPTVTLMLTLQDAMKVRLAALNGDLSLVLRGIDDTGGVVTSGIINETMLYSDGTVGQKLAPRQELISVRVKDPKTGKEELMKFQYGHRVYN